MFLFPRLFFAAAQKVYNTSRRDQFLMKFHHEFEVVRVALLNMNYVPSLDICVGELSKEQQCLLTPRIYHMMLPFMSL